MGSPGNGVHPGPAPGEFPEIVIAPARPDIRPGHDGDVIFEVRQAADGRPALPVFSTVKRLVAALGPEQPWVALPLRNVQAIVGGAGVDRVIVDPDVAPASRRWQASDIEALERRQ